MTGGIVFSLDGIDVPVVAFGTPDVRCWGQVDSF